MSDTTHITWATHTASPWYGCAEVSPGCRECYARKLTLRYKWAEWGKGKTRVPSKSFVNNIRKWNKAAALDAKVRRCIDGTVIIDRPRVFSSLMDPWDEDVLVSLRMAYLFEIYSAPNLDFLMLTKRPENWFWCMNEIAREMWKGNLPDFHNWINNWLIHKIPPRNVWFGVTCENQQCADERLPQLIEIPAVVRWVSAEPLLGPLTLQGVANEKSYWWLHDFKGTTRDGRAVDWVVIGGESGKNRRDIGVAPLIALANQCADAGVATYVKQDCALKPGQQVRIPDSIWALKQFPKPNVKA